MNTQRLLQSVAFVLLLGGSSAPALAGPSLFECLDGLAREAPEYSDADRQWLCGSSSNSPVPGYGERREYVSCLLDAMAYRSMRGRGDLVTEACATRPDDRSADTQNLPTRLYCLEAVGAANQGYGEADLRWLCGLSSNAPAPGAGDRLAYVSCVVGAISYDPSMAGRGDVLVDQCNRNAERADARTQYLPSALYCISEIPRLNSNYRDGDVQWLCGTSSNSPASGYGERPAYVACLTDTLRRYPSMAGQGDILVRECMQESDQEGSMLRR